MDTSNNRLVSGDALARMVEAERERYTPVPDHLLSDARRLMGDASEVHVPRSGSNPLTIWSAAQRRKEREKKRAAKAARKRNRR